MGHTFKVQVTDTFSGFDGSVNIEVPQEEASDTRADSRDTGRNNHGTSGETSVPATLDWASPLNREQVRQRFEMLAGRVKRSKDQYWNNFVAFADKVGLW